MPGPLVTGVPGTFSVTSASSGSVSLVPNHSQTNVQVAGVDELDMVKTDGTYLYTVTNNTVAIVLADPTVARLLARVTVNGSIQGIFIDGSKLAIVTQRYPYYSYLMGGASLGTVQPQPSMGISRPIFWGNDETTSLWIFDVSNHSNPTLTTSLTVNGTMAGARLIGNYAYLVATQPVYCNGPPILPENVINDYAIQIAPLDIYHSDIADYGHSFTTVVGIDVSQSNPTPTSKVFLLGTSSTIYVSTNHIYLTQPLWNTYEQTAVHRISIDGADINYEATGTVTGHVLNQFSMDEYNGYFRIATNDYGYARPLPSTSGSQPITYVQPVQHTNLYVLDSSLHIVGSLEGLSPGEAFYAARFMGDRAYLVTYQRMDPLFVIGLSNPLNPRVLGQLVISGVSDYLQPYDEYHLIGFGKSSTNVTWENAALFQGLKLSLFDVTDPTSPVDVSNFLAGDRGSDSPALTDHTAVLFEKSLNLLVIPVEIAQAQQSTTNPWSYNTMVFQGAYVFSVTLQNGIVFRGGITHLPPGELPTWNNSNLFVKRALYIGNVLYTVSDNKVMMNSLSDLSELRSISLA
jgi:inhibitor of cysteine peptidase